MTAQAIQCPSDTLETCDGELCGYILNMAVTHQILPANHVHVFEKTVAMLIYQQNRTN